MSFVVLDKYSINIRCITCLLQDFIFFCDAVASWINPKDEFLEAELLGEWVCLHPFLHYQTGPFFCPKLYQ